MQENNKDFPFSPKWVWDFQYIGHGANKLASQGKNEGKWTTLFLTPL